MASILVINGHPDPSPERFVAALSEAYAAGAIAGGHTIARLSVGDMALTFLSGAVEFGEPATGDVAKAQEAIAAAEHVVVAYPLWLGTMPAKLKAFFEQAARADFLLSTSQGTRWPVPKMAGRSARLMVTMGMPGIAYRLFFGAHSLKGVEAGIFRMAGFRPVRSNVFGSVDAGAAQRSRMLKKAEALGRKGL